MVILVLLPGFVLYDTKTEELDFIDNKNMKHEHGACNPAAALAGREVDTVVVGGIGRGAIVKLSSGGGSVLPSPSRALFLTMCRHLSMGGSWKCLVRICRPVRTGLIAAHISFSVLYTRHFSECL